MHQLAAVEMRDEFHSRRQQAGLAVLTIQLVNFLVEGVQRGLRNRPFAQQDDSLDHVIVVEDGSIFPVDSFSKLSEAYLRGLNDIPEITDPHRSSVLYFDDGGRDVVGGLHQADGADIQCLFAALNETAASVDVVG